jgi:hypothetical protein
MERSADKRAASVLKTGVTPQLGLGEHDLSVPPLFIGHEGERQPASLGTRRLPSVTGVPDHFIARSDKVVPPPVKRFSLGASPSLAATF